jgi:hypothetical protein
LALQERFHVLTLDHALPSCSRGTRHAAATTGVLPSRVRAPSALHTPPPPAPAVHTTAVSVLVAGAVSVLVAAGVRARGAEHLAGELSTTGGAEHPRGAEHPAGGAEHPQGS